MGMMRILDQLLQVQRGHLLAWGPVFLGLGIGVYFALPVEPGAATYASVAGLGVLCAVPALRPQAIGLLARAALLVVVGFNVAGVRAHLLEAPVLSYRYYGPVEGQLVHIDRSGRDHFRLTLDEVRLRNVPADRTPAFVRLSVLADDRLPPVGARIATTAHLLPPQGPAEPGGFDFRRHAWFKQLGASGYTKVAVMMIEPADTRLSIARIRQSITSFLHQRLPGEVGAVAAAITTGDRSGVNQATLQDLRASNLAHLLAISGLHMGLVAGFVFGALRFGLCLIPALALRVNTKKIAAAVALVAASGYLALSGGNVATERAFIMVVVMFGAVLMDRRAISLRAVAVAAFLVLLRRPETLLSPGFQMSFAATAALVGIFAWVRDSGLTLGPSWLRPVTALMVASLVAGLATAPFGAAHFNTMSHYGLPANLLAVPVMGMIVVPAAIISLCLLPFGAEALPLGLLDAGLRWILWVAESIADLPGAQRRVIQPDSIVLPLMAFGALVVLVWHGRLRWVGVIPVVTAFGLWTQASRPLVLVGTTGQLVGVLGPEGRALSRDKGQSFAARIWLENDGDVATQTEAFARWNATAAPRPKERTTVLPQEVHLDAFSIVHVTGHGAARLLRTCTSQEIVIATVDIAPAGPCEVFGPERLRRTGSLDIDGLGKITTASEMAGIRLWTGARTESGNQTEAYQRPGVRSLAALGSN